MKNPRIDTLPLILLTVAGAVLRLAYLDRPIYTDEAYTYLYFIQDGLADVLTDYREPNNHVFQTILAWAAVAVGGASPAVLRVPALVAGVLLIPATYWATVQVYNARAALYAAALVAVNVPLAEYAVSARGYSLIALFTALLIGLAARLKTDGGVWRWAAYGTVAALGLWTVPTMLYPLGGVSLWLLVSIWADGVPDARWRRTREMAITLGLAAVGTVVLYIPILLSNGVAALTGNPFVTPMTAIEFGRALAAAPGEFFLLAAQGGVLVEAWTALALLFAGLSIVAHRRLTDDTVPIAFPMLTWTLVLVTAQFVVPPLRVWIHLTVLLAMMAGAGLDDALSRATTAKRMTPLVAGGLVILLGGSIVATDALNNTPTYRREADAEAVGAWLAPRWEAGDRVLLTNGAVHNYEFYMNAHGLPWGAVALTYSHDEATTTTQDATLYVLTRMGDPFVAERLREAVGVDLGAGAYQLEALATMPAGEIVVNQLVATDAD